MGVDMSAYYIIIERILQGITIYKGPVDLLQSLKE